jgi:hypothetical protein
LSERNASQELRGLCVRCEPLLATRPLTIIDPRAAREQRWWLHEPPAALAPVPE